MTLRIEGMDELMLEGLREAESIQVHLRSDEKAAAAASKGVFRLAKREVSVDKTALLQKPVDHGGK